MCIVIIFFLDTKILITNPFNFSSIQKYISLLLACVSFMMIISSSRHGSLYITSNAKYINIHNHMIASNVNSLYSSNVQQNYNFLSMLKSFFILFILASSTRFSLTVNKSLFVIDQWNRLESAKNEL